MAPTFLLRKSDSKVDLASEQSGTANNESSTSLPGASKIKNKIGADRTPSALQRSIKPIASGEDGTGQSPPKQSNHRFLSTVSQLIRHRPSGSEAAVLLSPPAARPRSSSAPSYRLELGHPSPFEIPIPPSPKYSTPPSKPTDPQDNRRDDDSLDEQILDSAWIRKPKLGKPFSVIEWQPQPQSTVDDPVSQRSRSDGSIPLPLDQKTPKAQPSTSSMSHHGEIPQISPQAFTSTLAENWQLQDEFLQLNPSADSDEGEKQTQAQTCPLVGPSIPQEAVNARIEALHAAHIAQISDIREDHAQEVANLRIALSLLETKATLPAGQHLSPSGLLPPLDTSTRPHSGSFSEMVNKVAPSNSHRRTSSASTRSVDALVDHQRRQLDEQRLEIDQLRYLLKQQEVEIRERSDKALMLNQEMEAQKRIVGQMRGALLRAAEKENLQKTQLANLENRLELANAERLDFSEAFTSLKSRNKILTEDKASLTNDLEVLEQQRQIDIEHARTKLANAEGMLSTTQTKLHVEKSHNRSTEAILQVTKTDLESAHRRIEELEADVDQLRSQTGVIPIMNESDKDLKPKALKVKIPESKTGNTDEVKDKAQIAAYKSIVAKLEAETTQLSALLSTEIRRAVRTNPGTDEYVAAYLERRASVASVSSMNSAYYNIALFTDVNAEQSHEACNKSLKQIKDTYEDEIGGLIKEIILYKLDIKGYKKDLRKAKHTIKKLESADANSVKSSTSSQRTEVVTRPSQVEREPSVSRQQSTTRGRRSASLDDLLAALKASAQVHRHANRTDDFADTRLANMSRKRSQSLSSTRSAKKSGLCSVVRTSSSLSSLRSSGGSVKGAGTSISLLSVQDDSRPLSTVAEVGTVTADS